MVQTKIDEVEGEHLLEGRSWRRVAAILGQFVSVSVVKLNCSEVGIIVAAVKCNCIPAEGAGLMRLEWRGDGEVGVTIAVKYIDELLLLDGADEDGTAGRVTCDVLARDIASAAALAEGFFVDLLEAGELATEEKDDDAAAVTADGEVVALAPDDAKAVEGADGGEGGGEVDLLQTSRVIGPEKLEACAMV
jgi:hypothetical protein